MAVNVNQVLDRADFVWCNGDMFQTQYLRMADDSSQADDVLIEAASENGELFFTKVEIIKIKIERNPKTSSKRKVNQIIDKQDSETHKKAKVEKKEEWE